jgi:hypothetical protein
MRTTATVLIAVAAQIAIATVTIATTMRSESRIAAIVDEIKHVTCEAAPPSQPAWRAAYAAPQRRNQN